MSLIVELFSSVCFCGIAKGHHLMVWRPPILGWLVVVAGGGVRAGRE